MTERTPDPLDAWVIAYLDGTQDAEAFAQLAETLRNDPAALDRFVELASLDRSLLDTLMHGEQVQTLQHADAALSFEDQLALLSRGSESAELVQLHGEIKPKLQWTPRLVGVAIAAVLILALTLTFVFSGKSSPPAQGPAFSNSPLPTTEAAVATLTDTYAAKWADGDWSLGSKLRPDQRLTLTQGFAEITTGGGAVVTLQAPATIELLDSDNAIYLRIGQLFAVCETDSSKGLLVRTPDMDITDLGTEFGVRAGPGAVAATVFDGEVAVTIPGAEPRLLTTNQTAQLVVDGGDRELVVEDELAGGFTQLRSRRTLANALRNDPAMIAYWGFEATDIVDGKLVNRARATLGRMDGTLGQPDKPNSAPQLVVGRVPGTHALRFEAEEFDIVRVGVEDARAIDGLEQLTIGVWVKPDSTDQISHHLVTKRLKEFQTVVNFGVAWDGAPESGYARNAVFFHGDKLGSKQGLSTKADSLQRRSEWMHLIVTYHRGERAIYRNGELLERLPRIDMGQTNTMDAELLIGAVATLPDGETVYLDGDLDELFILGRAISPDEVTTLYEGGWAQP